MPWRRLDARDLDGSVRGARVPAGGELIDALRVVMSPDQAFTGPTAAKIWGMPLPLRYRDDPAMWVSSRSRDRSMRRPGVVARRRTSGDVRWVSGYPVLDPARTWASLAAVLEGPDLTAVADRIVTSSPRLPALASSADLVAVATSPGRRGAQTLRAALSESRVGAWSRPESLLRIALTRSGIPEPRLNEDVPVGAHRFAAPDLAWPQFGVAVEYDGFWHDDPGRRERDLERHELLVDADWLVAHIRAPDLFPHPLPAVARVLRRLAARGYLHPAPVLRAALPTWAP